MSKKIAFIFPGQGSQFVGMGRSLYDSFKCAKDVFHEVDEALGMKLSKLMFDGDIAELTLTKNAQPAIMAVSIAALRVLCNELAMDIKDICYVAAGHSLGEYSALCAAGGLCLAETAQLLRLRGEAMQDAVHAGSGEMVALLGTDIESASQLAATAQAEGKRDGDEECLCRVANDNGGGQVVLSGTSAGIERAIAMVRNFGIKKAIKLQVSGPFHCPLMQEAADKMKSILLNTKFTKLQVPVIPNCTACVMQDSSALADLLVKQITSVVRWRETMNMIVHLGVYLVVELGPGQVLSKLAARAFGENGIRVTNFGLDNELNECVCACTTDNE